MQGVHGFKKVSHSFLDESNIGIHEVMAIGDSSSLANTRRARRRNRCGYRRGLKCRVPSCGCRVYSRCDSRRRRSVRGRARNCVRRIVSPSNEVWIMVMAYVLV